MVTAKDAAGGGAQTRPLQSVERPSDLDAQPYAQVRHEPRFDREGWRVSYARRPAALAAPSGGATRKRLT
jgi:hypothetical protein